MIRFRQEEDERRYLLLRSEVYRRIGATMPAALVSEVMRNLGKLEQLLHLEGVRQGLAVAELSNLAESAGQPGVRNLKAFQAHAMMYGSTDTPLRSVEVEWLNRWDLPENESAAAWLDDSPMRFAPQTLAEWQDEVAVVPGADLLPQELRRSRDALPGFNLDDDEEDPGQDFVDNLLNMMDGEEDVQERPDMLDRLRSEIGAMRSNGWDPKSWDQLIMDLHLATHTDAAFLDIQLNTEMGRTVLAQCGIHLSPGRMFLNDLMSTLSSPAEQEEPEPEDSGAAEDGGADPHG